MEEQHEFTDYSFPQGGGACFTMCFYSACILSCVRDFHISHTLVNHNWTVVTQKKNSKHVCFQFGSRGPAKAEADSETTSLSDLLASSPPQTERTLLPSHSHLHSAGQLGLGSDVGRCPVVVWWGVGGCTKTQSLECCTNPKVSGCFLWISKLNSLEGFFF